MTGAIGPHMLRRALALVPSLALATAALVGARGAQACELVLSEHRVGVALKRIALPERGGAPFVSIAFEHSVLGTTVVDRYEFRPEPWLVEERYDGYGYGLPYAAQRGERLERLADGWRLTLERKVDPLVVRPLPAQHMRLIVGDTVLVLASLSTHAIAFTVQGCH
ncbi:MAG: DUF1850 domain-containing protein [Lautropia sp.]